MQAAQNRARFGTTKAQRQQTAAENDLTNKKLQGHRLDSAPDSTEKE